MLGAIFGEITHYHHWSLHLESTVRMRLFYVGYNPETGTLSYNKKPEGLSLEIRNIDVPLQLLGALPEIFWTRAGLIWPHTPFLPNKLDMSYTGSQPLFRLS